METTNKLNLLTKFERSNQVIIKHLIRKIAMIDKRFIVEKCGFDTIHLCFHTFPNQLVVRNEHSWILHQLFIRNDDIPTINYSNSNTDYHYVKHLGKHKDTIYSNKMIKTTYERLIKWLNSLICKIVGNFSLDVLKQVIHQKY